MFAVEYVDGTPMFGLEIDSVDMTIGPTNQTILSQLQTTSSFSNLYRECKIFGFSPGMTGGQAGKSLISLNGNKSYVLA
jgi:hypothetical protein